MSVDDAAEAMDGYERQRAALLASVPRMPHHWQEAGRSLYEQAHLARRLGRHPESRALMLEAVTRLGSIALPQAWFEVADWAWEDGDHDVAGRLYHDAMFKTGGCTEEEAQRIVERLRSLGDDHGHPWVWAALMRASLGDPGEDSVTRDGETKCVQQPCFERDYDVLKRGCSGDYHDDVKRPDCQDWEHKDPWTYDCDDTQS